MEDSMLYLQSKSDMGRTYRHKRKKLLKHETQSVNVSSENSLIKLIQWMKQQNWKSMCKLQPNIFYDTGRGMKAQENIQVNDILISIPKHLLITSKTVMTSNIGILFKEVNDLIFPTSQQILSTFLAIERKQRSQSMWSNYLLTIPTRFSTPFFCHVHEILPDYIKNRTEAMKKNIKNAYTFVISRLSCHQFPVLSWDEFLWAWFAVNSRAVYVEPDTKCSYAKDKDCLALAPYLDLINHSPNIPVNKVGWKDDEYQLRSSAIFKKHEQVFINYGAHDNMTLCLEYGFVVPNNPHDFVSLTYQEICDAVGVCCSSEPDREVYCTQDGLSWQGLNFISKCLNANESMNVYDNESVMTAMKSVIEHKMNSLQQDLRLFSSDNISDSYKVIKSLLTEHLNLLKKAMTAKYT